MTAKILPCSIMPSFVELCFVYHLFGFVYKYIVLTNCDTGAPICFSYTRNHNVQHGLSATLRCLRKTICSAPSALAQP
jgi:hypothetical protein